MSERERRERKERERGERERKSLTVPSNLAYYKWEHFIVQALILVKVDVK